jgi:hypothetical protein
VDLLIALLGGRAVDFQPLASSDELRSLRVSFSNFTLLIAWSVSNDLRGESEEVDSGISAVGATIESLFFDKNPTAKRLFLGRIGGCIIPVTSSDVKDGSLSFPGAARNEESS